MTQEEENGNIIIKITPYIQKYDEIINDYAENAKEEKDALIITFNEKFSAHKLKCALDRV